MSKRVSWIVASLTFTLFSWYGLSRTHADCEQKCIETQCTKAGQWSAVEWIANAPLIVNTNQAGKDFIDGTDPNQIRISPNFATVCPAIEVNGLQMYGEATCGGGNGDWSDARSGEECLNDD